ncbi:T9SS type A sorting domain-containing protein [Crocinitomix catalasitica]|uniref:T9SS type A sorting domain-containing protein n=1 Tax=Crocinitomix catalasitica TaxID=184607 RepID=UPI0004892D3A|nr:T9SS type A sorting domain-containing protein [Crocinitomix catalasitica]
MKVFLFKYISSSAALLLGLLASNTIVAQTGPAGVGNSVNNQIWLDANSTGFPDGGSVARWSDISGNDNHFLQPLSRFQPVFESSGIGGLPQMHFDGTDDVLASSAIPGLNSNEISYFVIFSSPGTSKSVLISTNHTDQIRKWITYRNLGTPIFTSSIDNYRKKAFNNATETSMIFTTFNSSNLLSYHDGILHRVTRDIGYTTSAHEATFLGRYENGTLERPTGGVVLNGEISEVIVFNTLLNSLERILIENYLGNKYGLTIPEDYYAHEGVHKFGIIGIGNDGTNTHTESQGTGILNISNPSALGTDEYALVGHDDLPLYDHNLSDVPPSLPDHRRWLRTWRYDENGTDAGTIDLVFTVEGANDFADPNTYYLLTDDDGIFINADTTKGIYNAIDKTVSFTVNITDGDFFTVSGISNIQRIESETTGDWNDISTWNCDCIPSVIDSVFVLDGHNVTVDANAVTNYLSIESGGTLTMDVIDVDLEIKNNFTIAGTLNFTEGELNLTGPADQEITLSAPASEVSFNDIHINNVNLDIVTFSGGDFILNGILTPTKGEVTIDPAANFIVNSISATEGGRIGINYSPSNYFNGNFTVRRNLPAGVADWRTLASPVIGATFAQWDTDIAMSGTGFPDGCAWGVDGCFTSVKYVERDEHRNVPNVDRTIENGRGYEIFIGDDLDVFSGATISSKGPLNSALNLTQPIVGRGWATIGNPYACPLNYNTVAKGTGISNYFYVYDATSGGFQWYDGSGGGSSSVPEITNNGLIAIGQGVWVFNDNGATRTVTYHQADKEILTDATFFRDEDEISKDLIIRLKENGSTYNCAVYITEHADANDIADTLFDVVHLAPSFVKAPSFAVITDTLMVRKNYIKKDGRNKAFDLAVKVKNDGYHTVSIENFANFRFYKNIQLIDLENGEITDLKTSDYTFFGMADTVESTRFKLILNNNMASDMEYTVGSPEDKTGTVIVDAPGLEITQMGTIVEVMSEETYQVSTQVNLVNTIGQTEEFEISIDITNGSNIISLPSHLKGFYIMTLRTGNDIVTKKIIL